MKRRLAAVMAADIVGFSRMMASDEAVTLSALRRLRSDHFQPAVTAHGGRVVKLMGDGALVEFNSVVEAFAAARDIQTTASRRPHVGDTPIALRIGINLGDVIVSGRDIYGDGVNVAARLEALAEPDGICISGAVHDSLTGKTDARFEDLGPQELKNIDRHVPVFRWRADGVPAVHRSTGLGKPSIVVLAFDNMSGDADQEFFSDGISEDLITALSHFSELFVIARNTAFSFKGQAVSVGALCAELGVRYLLEGSVRKAGNKVRVTAQLIDGETETHIWAGRFDRDLTDIFAVQDEITQAIVGAVLPETMTAETRRVQAKRDTDLSAWEMDLRARHHAGRIDREGWVAAREYADRAVALDPTVSGPLVTRAMAELDAMLHQWRPDAKEAIAEAVALAKRAIALDPGDAQARSALGKAVLFGRGFNEGLSHLQEAVRLNPNLANAHGVLAAYHGVSNEYDLARACCNKAMALSPRDPGRAFWLGGQGIGAYLSGDYEGCISCNDRVLRDFPGYASALRQKTAALAMLDRMDEAQAMLARLSEKMPGQTVSEVRHIVPIRYPDDHEHWLDGLRRAGMPEG
ncbi:adenylate/guanylate cyclase domain-containing protein [Shimia biformata]|uniref:adenylate/guanylate cyclase domain-containing protein n=1 Tax=Shimia biformata TaxID=1294299 RepID=UPI00194DEACE|nr:adenylate/guanylate cyclase domain-containing protein [Shimia biformata]